MGVGGGGGQGGASAVANTFSPLANSRDLSIVSEGREGLKGGGGGRNYLSSTGKTGKTEGVGTISVAIVSSSSVGQFEIVGMDSSDLSSS